jgi:polyferredoxin
MARITQPHRIPIAACAALLTGTLLTTAHLKVDRPMLLVERFVPGAGWAQIIALMAYAAVVAWVMADPRRQAAIRTRVWTLLTVVVFGQLALGLLGVDEMLMSGKLHLPVPSMILAGPLYRGELTFMVILLGVTLVLIGPAWCSHLCYFGALDDRISRARKRPTPLPRWRRYVQPAVLVAVVATALGLRFAGAGTVVATSAGAALGVVGVAVMLLWSRRTGAMVHCLTVCPIGWLATVLGRISPFRIRVGPDCDGCGACAKVCRYDALALDGAHGNQPGLSCTLCGDCVGPCPTGSLQYRWLWLKPQTARALFLVLVVSVHTAALGVTML